METANRKFHRSRRSRRHFHDNERECLVRWPHPTHAVATPLYPTTDRREDKALSARGADRDMVRFRSQPVCVSRAEATLSDSVAPGEGSRKYCVFFFLGREGSMSFATRTPP